MFAAGSRALYQALPSVARHLATDNLRAAAAACPVVELVLRADRQMRA
jgi:hypothetical protein